jgi:hypothetical protein
MQGRLEAIQREVEFEGRRVIGGRLKRCPAIVEIHHEAGMTAANAINAQQREPVDLDAFEGATLKHRPIPKSIAIVVVVKSAHPGNLARPHSEKLAKWLTGKPENFLRRRWLTDHQ